MLKQQILTTLINSTHTIKSENAVLVITSAIKGEKMSGRLEKIRFQRYAQKELALH